MSVEGPYRVVRQTNGTDSVLYVSRDGKYFAEHHSPTDADFLANELNAAHHHALAAQAERVMELEEALAKAVELLDGCVEDHNFDFGCEFDQIKATLAPAKEEQ